MTTGSTSTSSYVNLKHFVEFNKYTMTLAAAAFLYFDKFESDYAILRTAGALLSAASVVVGLVIMSALGRIKGDDIDYRHETDEHKIWLFKIISGALSVELLALILAIFGAGFLSLVRIWG
jgi:hypothetical protein